MRANCAPGIVLLGLLLPLSAAAQERTPVTDRDYSIDLFQGLVLGSSRLVGLGGAQLAFGEGATGMISSPSAPAIRPTTDDGAGFGWDLALDWLLPTTSSDFDNTGFPARQTTAASIVIGGLVLQYDEWGLGLLATSQNRRVDVAGVPTQVSLVLAHLDLARAFAGGQWVLGLGIRGGTFTIAQDVAGAQQELFALTGSGLEGSAVWLPEGQSLRLGLAGALPIVGDEIGSRQCAAFDCNGYVLPARVIVPGELAAAAAVRFAPTAWNRRVKEPYRDELAVLAATDVVLTGTVPDGSGLGAFLEHELQASGREPSISVRAGAEVEAIPGWLRLRAGSYWEPGRLAGISGRLHGTGGAEVRFLSFTFWDDPYRLRLTGTADVAADYRNVGVSLGFWH